MVLSSQPWCEEAGAGFSNRESSFTLGHTFPLKTIHEEGSPSWDSVRKLLPCLLFLA